MYDVPNAIFPVDEFVPNAVNHNFGLELSAHLGGDDKLTRFFVLLVQICD